MVVVVVVLEYIGQGMNMLVVVVVVVDVVGGIESIVV